MSSLRYSTNSQLLTDAGAMTSLSSSRQMALGQTRQERLSAYDDMDVVAPIFCAVTIPHYCILPMLSTTSSAGVGASHSCGA
ncbi:MAG: hypothetical protein K2F78_06100 [Muribaculaceae bacterium]|nr:hypothetical protein [Muribaculaceae bacterium]